MSLTLQYQARCVKCGGLMKPGDEAEGLYEGNNKWLYTHPGECPQPRPPARQQNVQREGFDVEDLYIVRKCAGECKNLTSFRKGGRITPSCPYCGGGWVRGNPDELAWAA